MRINLDDKAMKTLARKNGAASYGLTITAGMPFPAAVGQRALGIQEQLESLLPGRIAWYEVKHLHATIYAPLRGAVIATPPRCCAAKYHLI